jgi:hypothetical protein
MPRPLRLAAEAEASCPAGTKLVVVPRADGSQLRLLVPETVTGVIVLLNDDGSIGWIEDSVTGRGILDRVRPAPVV